MTEILTALGLMFVIEGSLYALFPDSVKNMMRQALMLDAPALRAIGLVFAVSGFVIVTMARSH